MTASARRVSLEPAYLLHHYPWRDSSRIFELPCQHIQSIRAEANLQVVRRHDHLFNEQADNAMLFGREQLLPNLVDLRHRDPNVGLVGVRVHSHGVFADA